MLREKPYAFEVMINANTESEERNYLKMKIIFDLQNSYPECVPYFRLKNLSPDYMDNKFLDHCENLLRERGEETLGSMMIYELCDLVKEKITNINDEVLTRLDAMEETGKVENKLTTKIYDEHMQFTPVTKETFGVWCKVYMAKLLVLKLARVTEMDKKPSGRQLF